MLLNHKRAFALFFLVVCTQILGCGYTRKSALSEDIKTVYIEPVVNAIDVSTEISDKEGFRVYRPGIEIEVTNAIIDRFIFDGNLKVIKSENADLIVKSNLTDYRRDPLRYTRGDDIQEYRLNVVLDVTVTKTKDGLPLWGQPNLVGDSTFFLSGSRAVSEDEAALEAVEDVARRVVEKTIEIW